MVTLLLAAIAASLQSAPAVAPFPSPTDALSGDWRLIPDDELMIVSLRTGKRVVIYQFAARELALGDWKVMPLP